jgi:hypothetical protein
LYKTIALESLGASGNNLGVKQKDIPTGINNNRTQVVKFAFDMLSYKVAHLNMANNDSDSYEVPNLALQKPPKSDTMRLDMVGFEFSPNPFYFKFTSSQNKDNWYLTTENMTLLFEDKFIQMDFLLPSQYVYGFGERMHDFRIGEGTWTMWASGQE